jgi:hypothetical protein
MKRIPVTYLCGPISLKDNNACRIWRENISIELEKMGIIPSNPFVNSGNNLPAIREKLAEASDNKDVEAIRYLVKKHLITQDLDMVKKSNFITAWIPEDKNYEICGSYGEITLAYFLGKPVYIVTDRNPTDIPHWAIGCSTQIFISWFDYYDMIKQEWAK